MFSQPLSISYYNKNWEKSTKKDRYYTREIYKKNDTSFLVKDYYLIDSIEMIGYFKSTDPEIQDGLFTFYYASGIKHYEGNYCNGAVCGKWIKYDERGNIIDTINYEYKTRECQPYDTSYNSYLKKDSLNYVIVDNMPRFRSKEYEHFNDYVQKNMFIPPLVNKYKITGSVEIEFTVDMDGSLCNFNVINENANKSIVKEALRILFNSPKWKPAVSNEYPVPVKYMMPMKIE